MEAQLYTDAKTSKLAGPIYTEQEASAAAGVPMRAAHRSDVYTVYLAQDGRTSTNPDTIREGHINYAGSGGYTHAIHGGHWASTHHYVTGPVLVVGYAPYDFEDVVRVWAKNHPEAVADLNLDSFCLSVGAAVQPSLVRGQGPEQVAGTIALYARQWQANQR